MFVAGRTPFSLWRERETPQQEIKANLQYVDILYWLSYFITSETKAELDSRIHYLHE